MRKFLLSLILIFSIYYRASAQESVQGSAYQFNIDLTNVTDDKVHVQVITPQITESTITYHMPAIVPGTYSIYDFGRFVSNFKAFDRTNNELATEQTDKNSWKISNADKLYSISYDVDDTWDDKSGVNVIFEPGGTNIEAGKDFVLNNHGFFGYFDGYKKVNYNITFIKPAGFYGTTALVPVSTSETTDRFEVQDYTKLVDSPIMYNIPDTSTVMIDNSEILIGVYSPNKKVRAKFVADNLRDILTAAKSYLGGSLPVDKYAFIFYFDDKKGISGALGALEHSQSSLYYLPEMDEMALKETIRNMTAHEFFHIVTPLNVHSEEIDNFSFNEPKMSKHLWLYEGVTEYNAHLSQVKAGLTTMKQFINKMTQKMHTSGQFNDTLAFTEMSENALGKYKNQYQNVYEKGALIGMCLDILLRDKSDGRYGIQNLLSDLSNKFGKSRPFKDDELFSEITSFTYPEVSNFLNTYVGGTTPLPYKELLDKVGIDYTPFGKMEAVNFGNIDFGFNQKTGRLVVADVSNMNEFGKKMGYMKDDELYSFNGTVIQPANIQSTLGSFLENAKTGDQLEMVMIRKDSGGKENKVTLKGTVKRTSTFAKHIVKINENPTPRQLEIRNAWLGIK
jgi:predicted metalloprotease with PDZ domain